MFLDRRCCRVARWSKRSSPIDSIIPAPFSSSRRNGPPHYGVDPQEPEILNDLNKVLRGVRTGAPGFTLTKNSLGLSA
jgi:hypothetical protein